MRHRPVLLGVLLASALVLSGCTSEADPSPDASPEASAPAVTAGTDGPFPQATGSFGEEPVLSFPDAEPSAGLQVDVLEEGAGAVVASGDLLVVDYLGQVWGGEVFDGSYERGEPATFSIGTGAVIQGWDIGLVGRTVGSRVLVTIPPDLGYGAEGNPMAGIQGTDTLVFVVDIIGAYASDAAGSPDATVTAEAASVTPVVEGTVGEPATIRVSEGSPEPAEVRTTVLARTDDGPAQAGQLVVQYAAIYWDNSQGESTWDLGSPASVTIGAPEGGVFDSLLGVPLGSRVLIELPATADTPAIAVVIDVLDQISVL